MPGKIYLQVVDDLREIFHLARGLKQPQQCNEVIRVQFQALEVHIECFGVFCPLLMDHSQSGERLAAIRLEVSGGQKELSGLLELFPFHRQRSQTEVGIGPGRRQVNGDLVIPFRLREIVQSGITVSQLRKDAIMRPPGFAKRTPTGRKELFQVGDRFGESTHLV